MPIKCRGKLKTTKASVPGSVTFDIKLQGVPYDTRGQLRIEIDNKQNCVYFGNGEKYVVTDEFDVSAGSTHVTHLENLVGLDGTMAAVFDVTATALEGGADQDQAAGVVALTGCNCAAHLSETSVMHLTTTKDVPKNAPKPKKSDS